ncbi:3772_t:CDS:2, partial [Entrophospora sp. SA101]
ILEIYSFSQDRQFPFHQFNPVESYCQQISISEISRSSSSKKVDADADAVAVADVVADVDVAVVYADAD